MINRRDFLKTMLAAGVAPAVVKAENIMKIWTPPKKKIILPHEVLTEGFQSEYSIEYMGYQNYIRHGQHYYSVFTESPIDNMIKPLRNFYYEDAYSAFQKMGAL